MVVGEKVDQAVAVAAKLGWRHRVLAVVVPRDSRVALPEAAILNELESLVSFRGGWNDGRRDRCADDGRGADRRDERLDASALKRRRRVSIKPIRPVERPRCRRAAWSASVGASGARSAMMDLLSATNVLDRRLVEKVARDLNTSPGLVKRNWHIVRANLTLSAPGDRQGIVGASPMQ